MLRSTGLRKRFRRIYLRRIGVLILFGLIHAVFFYMADVLVIYGLTALLLMPFRHWSSRRLCRVGGALLAVMVVWHAILSGPEETDFAAQQRAVVEEIAQIRTNRVIVLQNTDVSLPPTIEIEDTYLDPSSAEGRAHLTQSEFKLPMPADLAILVLDGSNEPEQAKVEYAVYSTGPARAARFGRVSFLAAAMTAAVFIWCASESGGPIRSGLNAVGRTALTNYIGQSVVMSLIAT